MGKVQYIKSSRKDWVCDRCHRPIMKGSSYYRGEVNFGPVFIRCKQCGLKHYEVTTSDYIRRVGRLVEDWTEDYTPDEDGIESIRSEVEDIQSDLQDRLDNMPEGLQEESSSGQLLQERIDMLEDALDELDNIDVEYVRASATEEFLADLDEEGWKRLGVDPDNIDDAPSFTYEEILNNPNVLDDDKNELVCNAEYSIVDSITDALSSLEY